MPNLLAPRAERLHNGGIEIVGFAQTTTMLRNRFIAAGIACFALGVHANDGAELSLKGKSLAATSLASAGIGVGSLGAAKAAAPFAVGHDPLPELLLSEEREQRGSAGACNLARRDVCYDAANAQIVYRPAREYMPRIDGLTAENVSVRHNRIVFTYSFR